MNYVQLSSTQSLPVDASNMDMKALASRIQRYERKSKIKIKKVIDLNGKVMDLNGKIIEDFSEKLLQEDKADSSDSNKPKQRVKVISVISQKNFY